MIQIIQPYEVKTPGGNFMPPVVKVPIPDYIPDVPAVGTDTGSGIIIGYEGKPEKPAVYVNNTPVVVTPAVVSAIPDVVPYTNSKAVPNQNWNDHFYNKLQLIVKSPHGLKVGNYVDVKSTSGKYDGIHKIEYIYENTLGGIAAIYFADIDFVTPDTGTVRKVNYTPTIPVNKPADVNTGTSTTTTKVTTPVTPEVNNQAVEDQKQPLSLLKIALVVIAVVMLIKLISK